VKEGRGLIRGWTFEKRSNSTNHNLKIDIWVIRKGGHG
jgi:hypothetical protein